MPRINFSSHPHILDLIIDALPEESIPALRATDRAIRTHIDRRFFKHVVFFTDKALTVTRTGHVGVHPDRFRFLGSKARAVDVRMGVGDVVPRDWAMIPPLPHLQCARVHREGHHYLRMILRLSQSVDAFVPTIIYRLCSRHDRPTRSVPRVRAARSILPLPERLAGLSYHGPIAFLECVSANSELVVALLPELNTRHSKDADDAREASLHGDWQHPTSHAYGQSPYSYKKPLLELVGALQARQFRCTIVTPETTLRETKARAFMNRVAARSRDRPPASSFERLRFLALDEWRKEVTKEEWELARHLPRCFKDGGVCPV